MQEGLKMDTSGMKNIVVLRDLPSNLVEEAIVVLKQNQKSKKVQFIESEKEKKQEKPLSSKKQTQTSESQKDYIVKEAQLLISEYIRKVEEKNKKAEKPFQQLKRKYKIVKAINIFLVFSFMVSLVLR